MLKSEILTFFGVLWVRHDLEAWSGDMTQPCGHICGCMYLAHVVALIVGTRLGYGHAIVGAHMDTWSRVLGGHAGRVDLCHGVPCGRPRTDHVAT